MNQVISISAFIILATLWLAFAAALLFHREVLENSWACFRRFPRLLQLGLALLLLPIVMGLGIWNAKWPAWLRLTLVAGLAFATITTFFPQAA